MELLVSIKDCGPDIDHLKAGDVIACQPDGFEWGREEINNPAWRILRVELLPSEADALLSQAPDVPGVKKTTPRRYTLDMRFPKQIGSVHPVTRADLISAARLK